MGGNAIGDKGAMHLANLLTGMIHITVTILKNIFSIN
jgi:hypothetical protein